VHPIYGKQCDKLEETPGSKWVGWGPERRYERSMDIWLLLISLMLVSQWGLSLGTSKGAVMLSPRNGCLKQEEAPLGEAALPRDTGPPSTSQGGTDFPPPRLLAGFLIGWEKPVSGRRQWVSTQCMLSGGVPVSRSKHQGALH